MDDLNSFINNVTEIAREYGQKAGWGEGCFELGDLGNARRNYRQAGRHAKQLMLALREREEFPGQFDRMVKHWKTMANVAEQNARLTQDEIERRERRRA